MRPRFRLPQLTQSYLRTHWRGALGHWQGFWLNTVLLRAMLLILGRSVTPEALPSLLVIGLILADLSIYLWQTVGLVRHGDRQARSFGATGHVWTGLLGLLLAFFLSLSIWWGLLLSSPLIPPRPDPLEGRQILRHVITLELSADGRQLRLKGPLPIGAGQQVAAMLEATPTIDTLVLDSPGGHIFGARDLARVVQLNGLATEITANCSSACTLVFMAGAPRDLGPDARLGFHSYGLLIPSGHPNIDPAEEMRHDRTFLTERGVTEAFLDQVQQIPAQDMWYPTRDQLRAAGILSR